MNLSTITTNPSTVYKTTKARPNGDQLTITISLDDEGKNGHADFSITGDLRTERGKWLAGGCLHEDIAKAAPKLAPFIALHLHEAMSGAPMHALANSWYFYELALGRQTDNYKPADYWKGAIAESLFLSPDELTAILGVKLEDQNHFQWYIEELGIPARWKMKAAEARALLFSLMPEPETEAAKWADYMPERSGYTAQTPEKRAELLQRIAGGYYTDNAKAARMAAAQAAKKAAILAELKADHDKSVAKLDNQYTAMAAVVLADGARWGWIYYDHTNTLAANWSSGNRVTREEFDRVVAAITGSDLPDGVKFEYSTPKH